MSDLLSVDTVLQYILAQVESLPGEHVPIAHALGRVLVADVTAAESIPPFANSSMDGYAVRAADVAGASRANPVRLTISDNILAGRVSTRNVEPGQAARIMTGAPLPPGADAVIPVEDTNDTWDSDGEVVLPDQVAVFRQVAPGDYVRNVGEDIVEGAVILRAGTRLRPQDIGVLVSLGTAEVPVFRQPRVAILSSGDELLDVGDALTPGKIRNSNSYVLAALVSEYGGVPIQLPVAGDSLDAVRRLFKDALAHDVDMIVSSAGVSVGTHDVIRTVVNEFGRVELWCVNLRPGKPVAFGHIQGVPFFGLPGNPVSAMVTFDIFVRPALLRQMGDEADNLPVVFAEPGETLHSDGRRSYLRVRLERQDDRLVAYSTGTQSSGALMSMVLADGLLIIPEGVTEAKAGSRYPVRLLRDRARLP